MKLSDYAKKIGVHYKTAYRWFNEGRIAGYQMDTGTIVITELEDNNKPQKVVIYTRVSSHENKPNLEGQAKRLTSFCMAKGWKIDQTIKEVGSGINDNRQKYLKILSDPTITIIVVEHKDRLTRFGFNAIETLLQAQNREVVVVNKTDNEKEDLVNDLVSIIYSFCARLYGTRKAKRKTECITEAIEKCN